MSTSTRMRLAAPYIAMLVLSLALYAVADRIEFIGRAGTLGPNFWPKLVLGLLILVCASEVVSTLFLRHTAAPAGVLEELMHEADAEEAPAEDEARYPLRLIAGVAASIAYVPLLQGLGFFLATWAFIVAFLYAGGFRRVPLAVLIGGVTSLVFLVVFMKLVYVSLPLGVGPFHELSLALLQAIGVR